MNIYLLGEYNGYFIQMKLVSDLFNILVDQSNYSLLVILRALNKRRTAYAKKYSSLSQYDSINQSSFKHIGTLCRENGLKTIKQLTWDLPLNMTFVFSAEFGHIETVKYLFDLGVIDEHTTVKDNWSRDNDYRNALEKSACNGFLDVVKYLIQIGVRHNIGKAMRLGACNGHLEVVKYLVGFLCEQGERGSYLSFAIEACAFTAHLKVIEYLVDVGAFVSHSALVNSAYGNNLNTMKYMWSKFDKNYVSGALDICLRWSLTEEKLEMVKFLANICSGNSKRNALKQAIHSGQWAIVEHLHSIGTKLD